MTSKLTILYPTVAEGPTRAKRGQSAAVRPQSKAVAPANTLDSVPRSQGGTFTALVQIV